MQAPPMALAAPPRTPSPPRTPPRARSPQAARPPSSPGSPFPQPTAPKRRRRRALSSPRPDQAPRVQAEEDVRVVLVKDAAAGPADQPAAPVQEPAPVEEVNAPPQAWPLIDLTRTKVTLSGKAKRFKMTEKQRVAKAMLDTASSDLPHYRRLFRAPEGSARYLKANVNWFRLHLATLSNEKATAHVKLIARAVKFNIRKVPPKLVKDLNLRDLYIFKGVDRIPPPGTARFFYSKPRHGLMLPAGIPLHFRKRLPVFPSSKHRLRTSQFNLFFNRDDTLLSPYPYHPLVTLGTDEVIYQSLADGRVELCSKDAFKTMSGVKDVSHDQFWIFPSGAFPNPTKSSPTLKQVEAVPKYLLPSRIATRGKCPYCPFQNPNRADLAPHYVHEHKFPYIAATPTIFTRPILLPSSGPAFEDWAYKRVARACGLKLQGCDGWIGTSRLHQHGCFRILSLFKLEMQELFSHFPADKPFWQDYPYPPEVYSPLSLEECHQDERFEALLSLTKKGT